jgi:3-hydroxyacyl-[acyl-carrier-protein] dehydratase
LIDILTLPHRPPFLLIDRIQDLVPGKKGTFVLQWSSGGRYQSAQSPPSFSQALLLEAMAEAAGLVLIAADKEKEGQGPARGFLMRMDRVSFDTWPRTGEEIRLTLTKKRQMGQMVLFAGEAHINGRPMARLDLTLWHGGRKEGN